MQRRDSYFSNCKQNLKVLTFNIHNGITPYGEYNLEQITEFIGKIKPDLAGLQEVSRFWSIKTDYQDMVSLLEEKLGMHPVFAAMLKCNNKGFFGNLVLSKFPIINSWTEILPGNLEARSCLAVQVRAAGARVNFLTTHLGLSNSERLAQVGKIVNLGVQLGEPLIITGDFNQDPSGPELNLIKRNWIKHEPSQTRGTLRLSDGRIGPEVDMIFTSANLVLKSMKVYENELSDHLPVYGEFEMGLPWNETAGEPVYYR